MTDANSKEVFIRLQNIKEIVELLDSIKCSQDSMHQLFSEVESLKSQELKIFEHWSSQLEDLDEKMEYLVL